MGLASYYRKFIPDFARIARPLHLLTRKDTAFEWTQACSEAFQNLKEGQVHPIAYASRSLDKHKRNYGISELETLGLVWAVRYLRPYILGHHATLFTDYAACTSLLNTARPSGKLARWALAIQEMNLTIRHEECQCRRLVQEPSCSGRCG